MARADRFTPPESIEEYRLLRSIGRGGMGEVFLGHDVLLDRPVAVKFIASLRHTAKPDAIARQRFLIEARAVARLQHPNVVTIHRVGEVAGRPFLVSEFVRGQCLSRISKPVSWERALQIGIGLSRGLAAAHRQGVLHRDIKPANAMLTEEGVVKLLDFGLAKLSDADIAPDGTPSGAGVSDPGEPGTDSLSGPITRDGMVLGTPLYMAPEVLHGEPASCSSDVYSLGAVLYELCTGHSPQLDMDTGGPATPPPIRGTIPGIDPLFGAVIDRCLRHDPGLRFESGDEVRDALEQLDPEARALSIPEGNPYRGLSVFEAEHRALFFGRGAEIRVILDRLRTESMVLLAGDSGVGKSSLCRAGVLPLFAREAQKETGRPASLVRLLPGKRPAPVLQGVLHRLRRQKEEGQTLIFIDQLEELFTLSDPADVPAVGQILGDLAVGIPGVRVLLTLRGDFLTKLAALPGLQHVVQRALYFLRPLSPHDTREAIIGPARRKGVTFESDALVADLLQTSTQAPGGLPLLQFALAELWDARDPVRQVIPASALHAIGGVAGALARHADGVLASLQPAQREAARRLLSRMVTPSGTRARYTRTELSATDEAARTALETLVQGRLVVASEADGETAYEVAHEVLLQGWDTLRRWLLADVDRRVVRQHMGLAGAEWDRLGRPAEMLWNERQLGVAALVDPGDLNEREVAFLAASHRAVRLRRLGILGGVLSVALLLLLVYGGVRLKVRHDQDRVIAGHLDEARTDLSRGRALDTQVQEVRKRALLLFDGPREADREAAEGLWNKVREQEEKVEAAYLHASSTLDTALSLDSQQHQLRDSLGDVIFERILLLQQQGKRGAQVKELLHRLDNYDRSGQRRHLLHAPAHLTLKISPQARIGLQRYADDRGHRRLGPPEDLGAAPVDREVPPGSYLLILQVEGQMPIRYPILLDRGERLQRAIDLPQKAPPRGYVYVPPGRFLFGSADDDNLRRGFLGAPPLHQVQTGGYLIARHEVTFADWIEYLRDLPQAERALRMPGVHAFRGSVALTEVPGGGYKLSFQKTTMMYTARSGEPIRYAGRSRRAVQDWLRFPVSAISFEDAQAYAAWLDRSGRVPGARLCDEREWERGARGADDRVFPGGDRLEPDDANFDETYGRNAAAFGPDEVGSHPDSESPFGLWDMAGNVWEWTRAAAGQGAAVRGGSWYHDQLTNHSNNREQGEPTQRDLFIGMRVCATVPLR